MVNKKVVWIVAIVLVVAITWMSSQYFTGAGERANVSDISGNAIFEANGEMELVDENKISFEFEGYNPARSHIGTFEDFDAYIIVDNGEVVGVKGVINASSVSTGIDKLDNHLRSNDFFDVEKYPKIEFISTNIDKKNGEIKGVLNFRGISKEISFPAEFKGDGISTEFFLNTEPFSFKYTAVNKEVRIKINFEKV
ncbi:MAG: YceI family protein [Nanoarchaeota archaeon]